MTAEEISKDFEEQIDIVIDSFKNSDKESKNQIKDVIQKTTLDISNFVENVSETPYLPIDVDVVNDILDYIHNKEYNQDNLFRVIIGWIGYLNWFIVCYVAKFNPIKWRHEWTSNEAINRRKEILKYSSPLSSGLLNTKILKYQGIDILSFSFEKLYNIVFLTGRNGFGKTSVLQSIAISLLDAGPWRDFVMTAKKLPITDSEFVTNGEFAQFQTNVPFNSNNARIGAVFQNLCAYGPSRLEITNDVSKNELSKKSGTLYSLFNTDGLLLNIERELLLWFLKKNEKYDSVRKTLLSLLIGVEDIKVDTETDTILYKETESKEFLPFQHIASGYRSIIAMMGDMIIRLFKSQPEITNPSELAGIVIIDELDLHLHPKWQYELPQMLVNTFPKIQFIVSTHSVIPFLGAPENSVFLKVTRDKENGTKVHKIEDIDIKNLTPNSILTSPIFDMDVITQINNENKEEIHTEEDYDDILKRKETQQKLKELAKDFQFPENLS